MSTEPYLSLTTANTTFLQSCVDQRDRMFNDVFLYSNFSFNGMCFILGIIIDRFGPGIHLQAVFTSYGLTFRFREIFLYCTIALSLIKTRCWQNDIRTHDNFWFYFDGICF